MKNALEVRSLTKRQGNFLLDDVSLCLPGGCVMGLIGENGAGKSTLMRILLGLCSADSGEALVLGESADALSPGTKEQIGVVFDECRFPAAMTPQEIGRMLSLCYRTWDGEKYAALLQKYELPPRMAVQEFSRGMKMKLSIAAALSHDSRLLLLDEATGGLDPVVREALLDDLLDFVADGAHSVLISSHILSDLEKICDYVALLRRGKLRLCEEKDALLDRFVVVSGSEEALLAIDPAACYGLRRGEVCSRVLAEKDAVPAGLCTERAAMEDILLYLDREGE